MTNKLNITDFVVADRNKDNGLYHFIATLSDNVKCRLIMSSKPEWKIIDVNRLLNVPCPVCRKDYYCNCMARYSKEFERELAEKDLLKIADL